jgi:hypothetical protein
MSSTEATEVFLHQGGGQPTVVKVALNAPLQQALKDAGISIPEESHIFTGECSDSLGSNFDDEDGEDGHQPADQSRTLKELGHVVKHGHIHVNTCRRIAVTVNYQSRTLRRRFSPATRIEVVTQWARRVFRLNDVDAANHVLRICGTENQPRPTQHLGEIVPRGTCSICFDLVPEKKVEG